MPEEINSTLNVNPNPGTPPVPPTNENDNTLPSGQVTSPNGDGDVLAKLPEPNWDEIGKNTKMDDFTRRTATVPEGPKVTAKPEGEDEQKGTEQENKEVVQGQEQTDDAPNKRVIEGEKQVVNSATTVPPTTVSEDARLAKLTDGERSILKRASKEAREFTLARLDDLEKERQRASDLEKTITTLQSGRTPVPQSYYENPNAFVLLPEYHQITQQVGLANAVVDHWTNALAKVKAGEEYQDLGVDEKGNIIVLDGAKPASPLAEAQITAYLNHAINQHNVITQQQRALQTGFQSKVQEVFNNVKEVKEKFYPAEQWDVKDSVQAKTVAQVRDGLAGLGITPANPLYELFSYTAAALLLRNHSSNLQQTEQQKKERIAEVAKKAGPNGNATVSGGSAAGSGASNSKDNVTFADFQKKIRGSSVSFSR